MLHVVTWILMPIHHLLLLLLRRMHLLVMLVLHVRWRLLLLRMVLHLLLLRHLRLGTMSLVLRRSRVGRWRDWSSTHLLSVHHGVHPWVLVATLRS